MNPSSPISLNGITIIDTTFSLYRKHFRLFIGIAMLYLIYNCLDLLQYRLYPIPRENLIYRLIEDIVRMVFAELISGVLIVAAVQVYLNRHITIAASFNMFRNIMPRYFPHVFIYLIPFLLPSLFGDILMGVISYISMNILLGGIVLLYLVCYYFQITWCLYAPIICVEDNSKPKPLSQSYRLIKRAWWRVCCTIFTLEILLRVIRLIGVVSFILLLGWLGLLGDVPLDDIVEFQIRSEIGFFSGKPPPYDINSTLYFIILSLKIGIRTFIRPIYPIVITLIYFNLIRKQETLDIQNSGINTPIKKR